MSTEEDECDSSSPLTVASQSDITSYLRTRADQITGLNISMSDIDDADDEDDDEETSMDGSLLTRFAQVPSTKAIHRRKARSVASTSSYLSQSCFAAISHSSPSKAAASDDLTELKWLSTFKFKDHLINHPSKEKTSDSASRHEDRVSQFINDLKTYQPETHPASYAVAIFLACYSMRDDKRTPWSLTMKQCYEYIQSNVKSVTYRRGWKNLLRQALLAVPCFIQKKDETAKSRTLLTIDPYYRPSLLRAYNSNGFLSTEKPAAEPSIHPTTTPSPSLANHFPPKATVKTKALPRLYERLCGEKSLMEDETDGKLAHASERKRPRSMSLLEARPALTESNGTSLTAASPRSRKPKKQGKTLHTDPSPVESALSKSSPIVTPCPSLDHSYSNRVDSSNHSTASSKQGEPSMDDERDSSSSMHSKEMNLRSTNVNHRRKPSPPKKRVPLVIPSHRANTRISRRIIEQDLRLLHQSALASSTDHQPLDLSKDSSHR